MELLESGTQNLVVPGVQLESSEEKYLLFFFPIPPENPYAKSGLIVTVSGKPAKMAGEKNDTLKTVIISDEKHQEIYRSGSYAGSLEDLEKTQGTLFFPITPIKQIGIIFVFMTVRISKL